MNTQDFIARMDFERSEFWKRYDARQRRLERALFALIAIIAIGACALLSGCQYADIYGSHRSDPFRGRPFSSAYDSAGIPVEGSVNELGITAGRCYGALCIEQSLGYDFSSGCYACAFGGPWQYTGRVSVRILGDRK